MTAAALLASLFESAADGDRRAAAFLVLFAKWHLAQLSGPGTDANVKSA